MPMNCRASRPGKGRAPGVQGEIDRIREIWRECRVRFGGDSDLLFGRFTIADAMYAPVVLRFKTYDVDLGLLERSYADAVLALPEVKEWVDAAVLETERIEQYEL